MKPGRELDEAVLGAIKGWTPEIGKDGKRTGWMTDELGLPKLFLPPVSTDDAEALRLCVPWLNAQGYEVQAWFYEDGMVSASALIDGSSAAVHELVDMQPSERKDERLAARLCRLVLAVSSRKERAT